MPCLYATPRRARHGNFRGNQKSLFKNKKAGSIGKREGTTKIALQQGTRKLAIREAPWPKAGPGQILIKIASCGVCGLDLHYVAHEHPPSGNVLGHEWSGEIVEVGEGVTNFKAGDRVAMATSRFGSSRAIPSNSRSPRPIF